VRADGWKANLSLEHPDFVRDVVVYEAGGWVVTACRDEEVRVWNRSVSPFPLHRLEYLETDYSRPVSSITLSRVTSKKSLGLLSLDRQLSAWLSMEQFASGPCDLMTSNWPLI
jgi:WD40 repeat protein